MEGTPVMKILYVEDELERNIPRLISLFAKYLTETQKKKLSTIEGDESGFGARPELIEDIVNSNGVVECYHSFVNALEKVINHYDEYSLFIIDRNLVNSHYDYTEIKAIDPSFTEQKYEAFFEREGDYLLHKLVLEKKVAVADCFYFLTAYGANDEIRSNEAIKTLIDFGQFNEMNFIEKGNKNDIARLHTAMASSKSLSVYSQNLNYCRILKQNIDQQIANRFLNVQIDLSDSKRINDNIGSMRTVYDALMKQCLAFWPELMKLVDDKGRSISFGFEWVKALQEAEKINSIQYNFFMSIWKIGSNFGSHKVPEQESIYLPTLDTVHSLSYALKDTILWFERAKPKQ